MRSLHVDTNDDVSSLRDQCHRGAIQVLLASSLTTFHRPLARKTCPSGVVSNIPSTHSNTSRGPSHNSVFYSKTGRSARSEDPSQPRSGRLQEAHGSPCANLLALRPGRSECPEDSARPLLEDAQKTLERIRIETRRDPHDTRICKQHFKRAILCSCCSGPNSDSHQTRAFT